MNRNKTGERALKKLKKGYKMGKILYQRRDELHER